MFTHAADTPAARFAAAAPRCYAMPTAFAHAAAEHTRYCFMILVTLILRHAEIYYRTLSSTLARGRFSRRRYYIIATIRLAEFARYG